MIEQEEHYRFTWWGKKACIREANEPIYKTLRPCREESVNFDTTENLFIEGDNLDALKLLQESYLGKVKMIYIDPPYNTGKDFIYKDNFRCTAKNWIKRTGANPNCPQEMEGRFHSDWLSMMYPRLKLARNLLSDDGVIFISVDHNEVANLKKLGDEIFGTDNFIEIFSWVKTSTPPALSTKSRKTIEYIICYEKNRNPLKYKGDLLDGGDQPLLNSGNNLRRLNFPKEKVHFTFCDNRRFSKGNFDRVNLLNDLTVVNGYSLENFSVEGEFKWTQDFLDDEISRGTTFVIKSEKMSIRFIRNEEGFKRPNNYITEKYTSLVINKKNHGVGTNENASSELINLMSCNVFEYSKPVSLIKYLMGFITEKNDIILDFFAGSSTTAHAVMQLNAEDGGNRKFIMVQIPEPCDPKSEAFKSGFKTIAEIGKERIRRAGSKIKNESKRDDLDVGFKVFKIK